MKTMQEDKKVSKQLNLEKEHAQIVELLLTKRKVILYACIIE